MNENNVEPDQKSSFLELFCFQKMVEFCKSYVLSRLIRVNTS